MGVLLLNGLYILRSYYVKLLITSIVYIVKTYLAHKFILGNYMTNKFYIFIMLLNILAFHQELL